MNNFKAAYINELFKLSKKKKITAAVVLALVLIVIAAVVVCTVSNFMGVDLAGKSEFSLMILPVLLNILIPLFIAFITIDMYCGEYSAGTIKITLLSPASRIKIYCARIAAVMTFAGVMLAFSMLCSFAVSVLIGRTELALIKIFASYAISLIPMAVITALSALIANIAKGSGSAFLMCLITYMVIKVLEILNPQYSAFFFTSGMNMYILVSAPLISFAKIVRLLFIQTGFAVAVFAAGYTVFENKEI